MAYSIAAFVREVIKPYSWTKTEELIPLVQGATDFIEPHKDGRFVEAIAMENFYGIGKQIDVDRAYGHFGVSQSRGGFTNWLPSVRCNDSG